jgi:NADH-quinone oxidoreductase subunit N
MNYLHLLKLVSPEVVVAVTALAVLGIGLTGQRAAGLCAFVAALGLVLATGAVSELPARATLFDGMLVISPLTSLFKIICLALALFTVALARGNSFTRHHGEYLALLLFATIGLMLLVGSEELLMIFIGLELTGLSLYTMAGFDKGDARSAEAGLKYFLFGSTASAFTLFGLSLIYGMCGTTSLVAIAQEIAERPMEPLLAAGLIMTLIGLAFKIAAAPFHLWAPDVYQGAPLPSAAFIASGSKVASFVVLGKILLTGFAPAQGAAAWHGLIAGWAPLVAALAAASIVVGNFVALAQSSVRRLLAYSAVAHAGYALLGLLGAGADGFASTLFYTTVYAITILGAFSVVAVVRHETGGDDIANFAGLRARSPLAAACMVVFLLSLAGMPPLAGFFGKFYLFTAAMRAGGNNGLLWLVVLALAGSLVSLYYYLAVLRQIFVEEPPGEIPAVQLDGLQRLTLAALAGGVLVLGVIPGGLVALIKNALL